MTVRLHEDVGRAIGRVVDPCSLTHGTPLSVSELGLVRDVEVDEVSGRVEVTLITTSPGCTFGPTIAAAVRREVDAVPGVVDAVVRMDHDAVWTEQLMQSAAALRLGRRRAAGSALGGLEPYDWSGSR